MKTYTFFDFQKEFPTERACLEYIFNKRYPEGYVHPETGEIFELNKDLYYTESRNCFTNAKGNIQVYPTANTIFHKSATELVKWFYVVFRMSQSKCGISAKQIQREIGVTYKTAWRMCHLIRKCLQGDGMMFEGVVEIDETFVGGKPRKSNRNPTTKKSKRGRGTDKTPVVGIVERDGRVRAFVTKDINRATLFPLIKETVTKGSTIYTDENWSYHTLPSLGYIHEKVSHKKDEYVRGEVHTNTIEGFWSFIKNGIRGAYKHTSKKYLQLYVNEYAFKWNHRKDQVSLFQNLLASVCR
ncbi:MAG: IS1595 family transposase [Balneola sp.]